jgi:hypothetical protein
MATESPYVAIAAHRPNDVRLGGALITMVEPHLGYERAYNRWYEDDHFYAGARVGPWVFAGRRWVATRELQTLRYPEDTILVNPVTSGCYISTYWHIDGHYDDVVQWSIAAMSDNLYFQGRTFTERTHVYTTFNRYGFGVLRRPSGPLRPEHALDHPFAGLVVEIVDAGGEEGRSDLVDWLREDFAPVQLARTTSSMCLAFLPSPRQTPSRVPGITEPQSVTRLVTLLWFLDVDPRQCWSGFLDHGRIISDEGRGQLLLAAPFIPTIPGTDMYVEDLR